MVNAAVVASGAWRRGAALAALLLLALPQLAGAQGAVARLALPGRTMAFLSLYVSEAKGFFPEAGIDLRVTLESGAKTMQSLGSGSVEFAGGTVEAAIRAPEGGRRPIIVAAGTSRLPLEIVARREVAPQQGMPQETPLAERLRLLKGRTIGLLHSGDLAHQFLKSALSQAGLDPARDVKVLGIGKPGTLLASLQRRLVDAIIAVPPMSIVPLLRGYGVRLASGPLNDFPQFDPFPYAVLLTMEQTTQARPELVRRVVRAWVKGLRFIHEHPEEARQLLKAQFKRADEALIEATLRLMLPGVSKDGRVPLEGLERVQKLLLEGGVLKQPIDLSRVATSRFLPE
ncbi:MAG: ABC transporter substrate-binding protein [Candidatus Tectomicrobia bacterium]|nr:ABC transporter substrate-binding protein [Candidatus Tectomicrobia bacterium]